MTKKVFYEKVGRRYEPVSEYDGKLCGALPAGAHLIICRPGGQTTVYNIDPALAPLIAASRIAEDAISKAVHDATEIRRQLRHEKETPLTPGQKAAWQKLIEEFGPEARQLEWASVRECAEAGAKALQHEAEQLMQHESVKLAYEHFQLVCDITKEHK